MKFLFPFIALASFSFAETKERFGNAPPSQAALDLCAKVAKTYQASGIAAALALLNSEGRTFVQTAPALDRFDFFGSIAHEAAFGGGRGDLAWETAATEWIYQYGRYEGEDFWYRDIIDDLYKLYFTSGRYAEARGVISYESNRLAEGRGTEFEVSGFKAKGFIRPDFPEFKRRVMPAELSHYRYAYLMSSMAMQDLAEGKWRRALEEAGITKTVAASTLKWYGTRKNLIDADQMISQMTDVWRSGSDVTAEAYRFLGMKELELAEYQEMVGFKAEEGRAREYVDLAECRAAHLRYSLGTAGAPVIRKLVAAQAKLKSNERVSVDDWQKISLLIADIQFGEGDLKKGWAILDGLLQDPSISPQMDYFASSEWCRHRVAENLLDGVEAKLIRLLEKAREGGVKRQEIDLYQIYARFLIAAGRLNDALRIQNELLRLLHSFDLYPRLPEALHDLARIQALMGQAASAEATHRDARSAFDGKKVPGAFAKRIGDLVASPLPVPAHPAPRAAVAGIDIQPRRSLMIPLASLPARGLFTLANPGGEPQSGKLILKGPGLFAFQHDSSGQLNVELDHDNGLAEITRPLTLAPGEAMRVDLSLAAPKVGDGAAVELVWQPETGPAQSAAWQAGKAEEGVSAAISDASEYLDNPFYLFPIYHLIQYQDDFEQALDVRLIASQPTRVELYDHNDTLVMVDAAGDGALDSKGDLVSMDFNGNGLPDLRLEPKAKELRFRLFVQPLQTIPAEGLVLELQIRQQGKWFTCATDRLLPSGSSK